MDDLARIFFPDNSNHRRAFVAIWVEIKHADAQFLQSSVDLSRRYEVSPRTLEIVRAKMKKLGLIKRVSHFNPAHGNQSGWTFSPRFRHCLSAFAVTLKTLSAVRDNRLQKVKDRDAMMYV